MQRSSSKQSETKSYRRLALMGLILFAALSAASAIAQRGQISGVVQETVSKELPGHELAIGRFDGVQRKYSLNDSANLPLRCERQAVCDKECENHVWNCAVACATATTNGLIQCRLLINNRKNMDQAGILLFLATSRHHHQRSRHHQRTIPAVLPTS